MMRRSLAGIGSIIMARRLRETWRETRERFDHTYNWTVSWGLVPPGATYDNTVDNRAWQ